ncbi:MAG: PHP domain-containing protein, partial [Pseudomonadota bacterium]
MKGLPGLVAGAGFPAVAVTDTNNLYGALEFSEGAAKAGVQPIVGIELAVRTDVAEPGARAPAPAPLVLIAQNEAGYMNLMALSSAAFLDTDANDLPHVPLDALRARAEGVICLTGGSDGPLGRLIAAGRDASPLARDLAGMFPDRLYIEIQRHGTDGRLRTGAEEATEPGLVALAYDLDLPLVATNTVYYATPEIA